MENSTDDIISVMVKGIWTFLNMQDAKLKTEKKMRITIVRKKNDVNKTCLQAEF